MTDDAMGRWRGKDPVEVVAILEERLAEARREIQRLNGNQPTSHKDGPPAPDCRWLFGIDDPFEDGGIRVWIVSEPYYRENEHVDDSSSASSVIPESEREKPDFDEEAHEHRIDAADTWLSFATKGVLYGESMESCWDAGWATESDRKAAARLNMDLRDPYDGKTRDEAIDALKAELVARGFVHEPKLDGKAVGS